MSWRRHIESAASGARLLFLLSVLAIVAFEGVWSLLRFKVPVVIWLAFIWSMPWVQWGFALSLLFPLPLRIGVQVLAFAAGFGLNTALGYIAARLLWSQFRHRRAMQPRCLTRG
jgi:hypothetical protein